MYCDNENVCCFEANRKQGPFPCEYPGCSESTNLIRLTKKELGKIKGKVSFQKIYDQNLGRGACEKHFS
ncbi:hypothetical protein HOC90_01810 [Candidatus Falkowbacteria bacterium]|jgi:hypothetical protein|nr:hypothetical protein [Candidatus Falkowbacteria bacterium]